MKHSLNSMVLVQPILVLVIVAPLLAGDRIPFYKFSLGPLADPKAVAITDDGDICVVERAQHRIRIFNGDGKELRSIGGPGNGPGQLHFPEGIAVAPDGNLLVASYGTDEVLEYVGADGAPRGWLRPPLLPVSIIRPDLLCRLPGDCSSPAAIRTAFSLTTERLARRRARSSPPDWEVCCDRSD